MDWVVVVPVKPAAAGKTRLAGLLGPADREALVRAMALDTIAAAARTPGVARVVVVTSDEELRRTQGVEIVDDVDGGLNAAVRAGVARVGPTFAIAVLLGDLPALRADDLAEVLAQGARHERAVVPDADGTGTTVLTASPGVPLDPKFGAGSAAAHEAAGHVRLDVPVGSSVRRDVDVPDDLSAVALLGVGPRTRALLTRPGT